MTTKRRTFLEALACLPVFGVLFSRRPQSTESSLGELYTIPYNQYSANSTYPIPPWEVFLENEGKPAVKYAIGAGGAGGPFVTMRRLPPLWRIADEGE